MKRSRLIAFLVLFVLALAGGRLLLRDQGRSVAALAGPPKAERREVPQPAARLAALEEKAREDSATTSAQDADVTPIREEKRVSVSGTQAESERDLVVRVIDSLGAPVEGLTLTIQASPTEQPETGVHKLVDPEFGIEEPGTEESPPKVWSQESDAEGLVVFEAMEKPVADLMEEGEVYLEHQVIFLEKPRHPLTPSDLELDEIVLVQPDYGTIRGIVRGPDGQPGAPASEVRLEVHDPTREDGPLTDEGPWIFSGEPTGDVALFSFVELNREWTLQAVREHGFVERTESAGPRRHQGEVEIAVQYGATQPILQFRLIDEHGEVLAKRPLSARLTNPFNPTEIPYLRTDERGDFLLYASLVGSSALGSTLVVTHEDDAGQTSHAESAKLEGLKPGLNDLGTLQLQPAQLLAQGMVLDEENLPVDGAIVRIGKQATYRSGTVWGVKVLEERTDATGRFEFRGLPEDSPRFVWAFRADERAEKEALQPGGGNHVLKLRSLPTAIVDVLVEPGVSSQQIQVVLFREGEDGEEETQSPGTVSELADKSRFNMMFHPVEPGTYGARVLLTHSGAVLEEIVGLSIDRTATIATFDLRGRLFVHRLLFEAPEAKTLKPNEPRGKYAYRPHSSDAEWSDWLDFEGPMLELTTLEPAVDIRLMPEGFHSEEALGLQGERTIQLRDPLRVRLVLDTTGEFPPAPSTLMIQVIREGQSFGLGRGGRTFSESRRELLFDLPAPGSYKVHWLLFQESEAVVIQGLVLKDHAVAIEVADHPSEQVIRLPLDGEALTDLARNPPW